MQATVRKPYRSGCQQLTFDRLAVQGRKLKLLRHDGTAEELKRGIKQIIALYKLGARFDEVLIQVR